jgi:predicted O-methyltransferase YrrM
VKKFSVAVRWIVLCQVVAAFGWFALGVVRAADKKGEQDMPSTSKQNSREEFIKNFKRIGLNTTPGDAMLLRIMIESSKAKRGVEVGTATGYGAVVMGMGFERNGGQLTSVDIDPKMVKTAQANIEKMGLQKVVTVVEGDALKVLPKLEGEYDFVFIDALKRDYLKYLKALEPKLKPGAVIVADNVIKSEREMKDYLDYMQTSPNYHTVIIIASQEKSDGMAVSYKLK